MSRNAGPIKFAVLATDIALFTFHEGKLLVRTIPVNRPPFFVKAIGLPGGLLDPKETAEQAALRLARDKAGVTPSKIYMEQLYTFSAVKRDPRGRVVAVAYLALVPWEKLSPSEQKSTDIARWGLADSKKKFAYDHGRILTMALQKVRSRAAYTTLISKLMPQEFTLTELENVYKQVLNENLDKRNFRKKILKLKIVTPVIGKRVRGRFRPAQVYRFTSSRVGEIEVL